ncbi:MAG: tRNA pseudouridine(55) synthase TruB [Elusimicrobiales bacterium]|nr:tRNA pseudouridine(55) synthase TruB [Elusimicrobiales bacterium]NLH38976.1 tRNA pseudouridine(55) synthase TruB [Elusimicrobiota bacterium]
MNNQTNDVYGILFVDKSKGITSHDAVNIIRRKLNIKRIGHTGTLDPLATGLLIILVGKYTSRQKDFQKMDKVYRGKITLGIETDTWDADGKILKETEVFDFDENTLKGIIKLLSGNIIQTVPPYSAVKYKGQTLYKLVRKNKSVPTINRMVTTNWLDWKLDRNILNFKIKCSSGTYIRSIAHQIGNMLGTGGTLTELERLEIGEYKIELATSIDRIEEMDYSSVIKLLKK